MNPTFVEEYATEGSPILVADIKAASHWRGGEDDGSGVIVEYMGQNVETLPKELLQTAKPGRQIKKFPTLVEARAFETRLLAALKKLHPEAERHPRFPDQPAYYLGPTRVYSVETRFTSMIDSLLKRLKSDIEVVVLDKKRKAMAVAMQLQGAGRGLIVADPEEGGLAIAKFHHQAPSDKAKAAKVLAAAKPPKAKRTIKLDGRILIFDSSRSEREMAELNWKRPSLAEAAPLLDKETNSPLRVPEQQAPGGAFVQAPAGEYAASYRPDLDVDAGAAVLWLTRR